MERDIFEFRVNQETELMWEKMLRSDKKQNSTFNLQNAECIEKQTENVTISNKITWWWRYYAVWMLFFFRDAFEH